ncbi:MAG: phosphate ABC transporter permease PstA [Methermicoccaceae archaeon]
MNGIERIKVSIRFMLKKEYTSALLSLLFSICTAIVGFTMLFTSHYLPIHQITFLILALLLAVLGIDSLRRGLDRHKSLRLLAFAGFMLGVAALSGIMPPTIPLMSLGFSANISSEFIKTIGMCLFGLIGVGLSMGPLYNFTTLADQNAAYVFLFVAILLVLYPLTVIVTQIIMNGAPMISWEFITSDVRNLGQEGGISSAIIGTLFLMMLVFLIALPLGVGCAIYLQEYATIRPMIILINNAVNILRGVPSIVFGLFAFAVFVPIFGSSFLTGGLTLAFYALPIIIRASEEALKNVPMSIREGSLALGATHWQTVRNVVLPSAIPGIITGAILGIGEAAGETAPLLFIATFTGTGFPPGLFDRVQALPTHLYALFGMRGAWDVIGNAWGTAFVLLTIVLVMNVIALIIRERYRAKLGMQ